MKNFKLPDDHKPYIDKYFLRAKEILQKDDLNPIVRVQVFIRKGDCKVYGINEAIAILTKYAKDVKIWALKEGDHFNPGEVLMNIVAPIQEIIDLETMYLGVLSAQTTLLNDLKGINLEDIYRNMKTIVDLIKPRPISYFGARHWRYDQDYEIASTCSRAGAVNCSTDEGAKAWGKDSKGVGTIPHALEAIYHYRTDITEAVFHTICTFDEHMNKNIPRVALIDYANTEVIDSLEVAPIVDAIRIDTCGENYMQGVNGLVLDQEMDDLVKSAHHINGKGVSVNGVYIIRKLLNDSGFNDVKIILSSGFGNPNKVKVFLEAEKLLKIKLFDSLGVGGVFKSRMATADIIEVGGKKIHKVGRDPKPDHRLERII